MPDQIIEAVLAQELHADACQTRPMVGWMVTQDGPDYPGKVVARLVTDGPTPYVLVADTLAALRAQLPADVMRSQRQPADPPHVVELWFST